MSLSQRQKQYLNLMGIPVYSERVPEELETESVTSEDVTTEKFVTNVNVGQHTIPDSTKSRSLQQAQALDSETEQQIAPKKDAEAVQDVLARVSPVAPTAKKQNTEVEVSVHDVLKRSDVPDNWSDLIDHVSNCTRCSLHETRTQTVFGVGNIQADWMIIGEAPGAEEDKRGEPFVGRAGQLLDRIIESIDLGRDKVYIANAIKCRPPANRDPKTAEMAQCRAYLEQQIALVDPKIIICVGRIASQNLLKSDEPISRLRGKPHSIQHPVKIEKDIPVIVTYHPAYLLRSPSQKRKVWDDLKLAFSVLKE